VKKTYQKAHTHLSKADPRFKSVIKKHQKKLYDRTSWNEYPHYQYFLIRSIIYQQISGRAAASISAKFEKLFKNSKVEFKQILKLSDAQFQSAGISPQKRRYIRDLAMHVENGSLPSEKDLLKLSDEEIIESLTQVKGIGVWTVQMLLIFYLGRLDVFPSLDLGIKKGFQKLFGMRKLPAINTMIRRAEKWRPFRSIASRYLWLILDQ
jgi:DNA-3-methyladenine glycosylase II